MRLKRKRKPPGGEGGKEVRTCKPSRHPSSPRGRFARRPGTADGGRGERETKINHTGKSYISECRARAGRAGAREGEREPRAESEVHKACVGGEE